MKPSFSFVRILGSIAILLSFGCSTPSPSKPDLGEATPSGGGSGANGSGGGGASGGDASTGGTTSTPPNGNPAGGAAVRVAWVPKSTSNLVYEPGKLGIQAAAADLTAASGRKVTVDLIGDTSESAAAQQPMIQKAVDGKYDAIIVSPLDASQATPLIDTASQAGAKVLTFDADAADSKRLTYYGLDNGKAGAVAAQLLASLLKGSGNVAVLTDAVAKNITDRSDGFAAAVASSYSGLKIVATSACAVSDGDCSGLVEKMVSDHPEISGWFFARPRPLREDLSVKMPQWKAAADAKKYKVVAFDTIPAFLSAANSSKIEISIIFGN